MTTPRLTNEAITAIRSCDGFSIQPFSNGFAVCVYKDGKCAYLANSYAVIAYDRRDQAVRAVRRLRPDLQPSIWKICD